MLCAPDIEVAEVILFCFHKSKALADDEVAEFVLHHLSRVESSSTKDGTLCCSVSTSNEGSVVKHVFFSSRFTLLRTNACASQTIYCLRTRRTSQPSEPLHLLARQGLLGLHLRFSLLLSAANRHACSPQTFSVPMHARPALCKTCLLR